MIVARFVSRLVYGTIRHIFEIWSSNSVLVELTLGSVYSFIGCLGGWIVFVCVFTGF